MDFVAIDVETANADQASICQIGLARFRDGAVSEWKSYLDPQDYFDPFNVSIHGIDESVVRGAPTFGDIAQELIPALGGKTVVSHTPFDRTAIGRACTRAGVPAPTCNWLDSARVARRTWLELDGYGLQSVCSHIGYEYQAHDALEDAKAAARVLLAAVEQTGLSLEAWSRQVHLPVALGTRRILPVEREGSPEGPLFGEVVAVFTGKLTSMTRPEAADLAHEAGCAVSVRVTRETTLLVLGREDVRVLAGHEKSSKHRKAEQLIRQGQQICIVGEVDFFDMLEAAWSRA